MSSLPETVEGWLQLLETRHPVAIDLGLDRVDRVWQALGRPLPAKKVFTVAGTNGKGSTVAYISALLTAMGRSHGSYTSPHVFEYRERVRINGDCVTNSALIDAFRRVESARGETSLTYFEFGTLAAFVLMADAMLDCAVLEVGLGGRLDAVNIVDADCAIITSIGLDHQEFLGDDLNSIAIEKSGVMRRGRPVICGETDPPPAIAETAQQKGARLLLAGRDFEMTQEESGYVWRMIQDAAQPGASDGLSLRLPAMNLLGRHQADNLAAAVTAVAALCSAGVQQWTRDSSGLGRALQEIHLPGRLQSPAGYPNVLVDVGHNAHAARAVRAALKNSGFLPCVCVLAMLRDKDALQVATELSDCVTEWYCAGLEGARGRSGDSLASTISAVCEPGKVHATGTVPQALQAALASSSSDQKILVFGSFLTAASALSYFYKPAFS